MAKIWKTKPPGEEQEYLDTLFQTGQIPEDATASSIQAEHEIFKNIKSHVFRTHFNETKKKFKDNANVPSSVNNNGENQSSPSTSSGIMWNDAIFGKKRKQSDGDGLVSPGGPSTTNVMCQPTFNKPPIIVFRFMDPVEEIEKVVVMATLFSGSDDVEWELDETGRKIKLCYDWPRSMHDVDFLYYSKNPVTKSEVVKTEKPAVTKMEKDTEPVPQLYFSPKVIAKIEALKAELKNYKKNKDDIPRSSIEINLPTQVQVDKSSWKISGYHRADNAYIAEIELKCFQSKYAITKNDTKVVFDK